MILGIQAALVADYTLQCINFSARGCVNSTGWLPLAAGEISHNLPLQIPLNCHPGIWSYEARLHHTVSNGAIVSVEVFGIEARSKSGIKVSNVLYYSAKMRLESILEAEITKSTQFMSHRLVA